MDPPPAADVTYFRPRRKGPESRLEDAVVRGIPGLFTSSTSMRWTGGSVPVGAGLPDLLIVSFDTQLLTLATTSLSETEILAYLRVVGSATLPSIAESVGAPKRRVASSLERLEHVQAVSKNRCESFRLTARWREVAPEIIAIEVKVADWKRAIVQATRNRLFTHRSYVALPSDVAARIGTNERLTHFGVGLLSIAPTGEVHLVRKSRKIRPRIWNYYYQVASLAARHSPQSVCPSK